MTTTVNSDMIIYNQLAQTAYLERLQDNLNVFNEASNGAIIYRNEIIQGDFNKMHSTKLVVALNIAM